MAKCPTEVHIVVTNKKYYTIQLLMHDSEITDACKETLSPDQKTFQINSMVTTQGNENGM